jgi:hypothetical protein
MANTFNNIMGPSDGVLATANFAAVTACTTRGPTATASLAAANIIALVAVTTETTKISGFTIKGASTSMTAPTAAQIVTIWHHNGTTAFPIRELVITAETPNTTTIKSFEQYTAIDDHVIPIGHSLYASTTVTTTASTTAFVLHAHGAKM